MKELTLDDFKSLRRLSEQDRYKRLMDWSDLPKSEEAKLVYDVWTRYYFKSKEYYRHNPAVSFEVAVCQTLENNGYKVQRTDWSTKKNKISVDWFADKDDVHWAVECKNGSTRKVIFEGITHLLYFRWYTKNQRKLVLFINAKEVDKKIREFANSLGVTIQCLYVTNLNSGAETIARLASHFAERGVPKNEIIDKVKEVLPFSEDYVRSNVPSNIKRKYVRHA
jgi:Holliday junction resolvase